MTLKATEGASLEVRRLIKATRSRVYEAWTEPGQLKEWFGPGNVQTHDLVADVRVGGKFRWELSNAEGERMAVRGEYRELQPDRKVVFTWQWEDDEDWENCVSIVTVELSDGEEGTHLCLTHENLPNDKSRLGHEEGWGRVLGGLEEFLGGKSEHTKAKETK